MKLVRLGPIPSLVLWYASSVRQVVLLTMKSRVLVRLVHMVSSLLVSEQPMSAYVLIAQRVRAQGRVRQFAHNASMGNTPPAVLTIARQLVPLCTAIALSLGESMAVLFSKI